MSVLSRQTVRRIIWGLLALVLLLFFIVLQTPVQLVVNRAMPGNSSMQDLSGSLFSGSGGWHRNQLAGTVTWRWRWLDLLRLRLGYHLELTSADTRVAGNFARSASSGGDISRLDGTLGAPFMQQFYPAWPAATVVKLKNMGVSWKPGKGFLSAEGDALMSGGKFILSDNGNTLAMDLPALTARLSSKNGALLVDIVDASNGRFVDLVISPDMNVETRIHQRAVAGLPQFQNMAPDSVVLSLRQPLLSNPGS